MECRAGRIERAEHLQRMPAAAVEDVIYRMRAASEQRLDSQCMVDIACLQPR